jgi:acetamidase/formamidase
MPPTPDHELSHEAALHTDWDRDRDPAQTVDPGAVVAFDCLPDSGERVTPETTAGELPEFVGHHLTGPVAVRGADPGDTLRVDVLDVRPGEWGYTLVRPGETGAGLLPEEFPDPAIHHWEVDPERGVARFADGIELPTDPFPGVLGVAPDRPGPLSTGPPRRVGGNVDSKHLGAGATLYLPVEVPGALFSVGDGHALQGDGEVCVSAVETHTRVLARLSLADRDVDAPEFETPGPYRPARAERGYATTGVADDLLDAAKAATSAMVDRVAAAHDLPHVEAYMLCSAAMDLKIEELVDEPNYVVAGHLPADLV